jgi:hypothetical protein
MSFTDVPFAALRKLLLDLGFIEKTLPASEDNPVPAHAFYHADSDTIFLFRTYRPQEKVSAMDFVGVRAQLDYRGLLGREAFEAALLRVPA